MKAMYQRAFREAGIDLTPEQWVVLDHLYSAKEVSQTDLANGTFKDAPTVSRIIDKLAQKGLALRQRFPNDRRRYQVVLTPKGEEIFNILNPIVEGLRQQTWTQLTEQDYADFARILEQIRDNFPH